MNELYLACNYCAYCKKYNYEILNEILILVICCVSVDIIKVFFSVKIFISIFLES